MSPTDNESYLLLVSIPNICNHVQKRNYRISDEIEDLIMKEENAKHYQENSPNHIT
jgi:uncharacterized protein YbaR (Trm112 family)